jgi:murein L,D-transpeptidase YafK
MSSGDPTPERVRQTQARGVDPGGDIMVHGIRNGLGWLGSLQQQVDWTDGCIADTDGEIDGIWQPGSRRAAYRKRSIGQLTHELP